MESRASVEHYLGSVGFTHAGRGDLALAEVEGETVEVTMMSSHPGPLGRQGGWSL